MKKTTMKMIALCFLAALTLTNCKKGDTGPAGENGKDGNANVKSQTSTNLTWTFNNATQSYETNIAVAAITQDIVDRGAVLVYIQNGNTSSQLPVSGMIDSATILFFDFEYSVGNVKISVSNSDLDNSVVPQSTLKFKIVAMSASARQLNPNVQSYEEVKTTYNLSE